MRHFRLVLPLFCATSLLADRPAWVARSDENAAVLLKEIARYVPERAGNLGVDGLDEQILDLQAGVYDRSQKSLSETIATLEKRLVLEKDPLVRQDLEILLTGARQAQHENQAEHHFQFPYENLPQSVFFGIRSLLDDQVAPSRYHSALIRLRRYAGLEPGYTPIATLAEQRTRERLKTPGLTGPARVEVEKDLGNADFFINGIGLLLEKYKVKGSEEAYAKLKQQMTEYEAFVKTEVLPRSREDFRLPPQLYAVAFEQYGLDIAPAELSAKAHAAFIEIQGKMQQLAAQLAKEKGWPSSDYRDVIKQLKKDQIAGEAILPHYRERLAQIEAIIRREHLITLPDRPARIRIASAAESAQVPAPNMHPPRLVGNQGEKGEFVLPLNVPTNGKMQSFDDFTFAAASWTLTSHEARPGHELQFDSMVERGVSAARAVFAFNSTNVEGWGLYSEWVMFPYMPLDGQLISLQHRLLRAARAFLDPDLQAGKVTPAEANRVLREDVVLSEAMANQEVERYTFRTPGQACSYYYGYIQLLSLRQEVEKLLGPKFNAQRFHDFILSQGLLPPGLMRKAVLEDFVPAQKAV